jgi:hypothetical protein
MAHCGASAGHPEFRQFLQHLVQAPLFASIDRIKETVAVFNPNQRHYFERSSP